MKVYEEKHGYIVREPATITGMHKVTLKTLSGEVIDSMRCDTASQASEYVRAFRKIAKTKGS